MRCAAGRGAGQQHTPARLARAPGAGREHPACCCPTRAPRTPARAGSSAAAGSGVHGGFAGAAPHEAVVRAAVGCWDGHTLPRNIGMATGYWDGRGILGWPHTAMGYRDGHSILGWPHTAVGYWDGHRILRCPWDIVTTTHCHRILQWPWDIGMATGYCDGHTLPWDIATAREYCDGHALPWDIGMAREYCDGHALPWDIATAREYCDGHALPWDIGMAKEYCDGHALPWDIVMATVYCDGHTLPQDIGMAKVPGGLRSHCQTRRQRVSARPFPGLHPYRIWGIPLVLPSTFFSSQLRGGGNVCLQEAGLWLNSPPGGEPMSVRGLILCVCALPKNISLTLSQGKSTNMEKSTKVTFYPLFLHLWR
ncbi:uncharacterized protein LOC128914930 isoform X1 [Rissa tridactyla]|uniref:uncharacterized protein LOC128914930 isoform X1 n=1 Tax=Rissa tridactyla TaxID=75485 RepID=UPI0023BAC83F|nr:uncharacterized protein LOC128914930 isoform X1 [Rissa tridactyla]